MPGLIPRPGYIKDNNIVFYFTQAALIIDLKDISGNAVCGASLLSSNRLVTAAHCWFDGTNQAWRYTVVLGSVLLFTGGVRVETRDVVTHPEWNPSYIQNDVAVIKLTESVSFSGKEFCAINLLNRFYIYLFFAISK